jgi:Domain of unknown function (DUF4936)
VIGAELYVYYRLKPEQAASAQAAFEAARAGAPVRLLQGQTPEHGLLTWMEVYGPDLPLPLEPSIAAAMAAFVQGARHHERFEPLI